MNEKGPRGGKCQEEQAWSSDEWCIASPGACLWCGPRGRVVKLRHPIGCYSVPYPFLPQTLICRGPKPLRNDSGILVLRPQLSSVSSTQRVRLPLKR